MAEKSIKQSNRILYYDILNCTACFGVVAMHFNGLVHAYSNSFAWKQALIVECIFYWAVPIFFMLTGATLMNYRSKYDTKSFFKKRTLRTLLPFLAWSLIALVWKVKTGQMNPPMGPRTLISMVLNTQIIDVYWFFIPLFSIYLSMPILSLLAEHKTTLKYGVATAFILIVLLPFVARLTGIEINESLNLPVMGSYIIYVVIGYLLKDENLSPKKRHLIYLAGIVGVVFRYFHTLLCSVSAGELVNTSWGYLNLPCFLESVAVFVLVKNIKWSKLFQSQKSQALLARISSCSFGIYLIHMIVFWYGLLFTGLQGIDIEWRVFGPIVCYILCLGIVSIGKRIPIIKNLLP